MLKIQCVLVAVLLMVMACFLLVLASGFVMDFLDYPLPDFNICIGSFLMVSILVLAGLFLITVLFTGLPEYKKEGMPEDEKEK